MILIGNTLDLIDWNLTISQCKESTGNILHYNPECFPDTADFKKLDDIWQQAGYLYNNNSIEWINFFPGADFDQSIVDKFKSIVNAEPLMVWISKIRPGKMAPWHFDAHQQLEEFQKKGSMVRFTCYIQEPQHGHISIVGESSIYRPEKGSIYQWPSYDAWHCGINGGLVDKYMFNFWGVRSI